MRRALKSDEELLLCLFVCRKLDKAASCRLQKRLSLISVDFVVELKGPKTLDPLGFFQGVEQKGPKTLDHEAETKGREERKLKGEE
jgi:hypothetical protein